MENSLLTKCPHCNTLFRIQSEHLAVAEGEVRCGVCFKVFNATLEGLTCDESENPENLHKTSKSEAAEKAGQLNVGDSLETKPEQLPPDLSTIQQLIIEEESVEDLLTPNSGLQKMRNPLLWGSLSITALLTLCVQWFWFNQDRYLNDQQWRPWYEQFCQHLPCKLKDYQAVQLIEIERLSIRSHPVFGNALRIELIIRNQAPFSQHLPALEFTFYDINGSAVAKRVFQPGEYTDNSVELNKMSVATPYHLSFSIIDPGEQAVNYGVQFGTAI